MTALLTRRGARLAAAALVLAYALLFAAIYLALSAGGHTDALQLAWWHLRVPGLDQSFGDLRTITHGIECLQRGIDPYVVNPCDPWWRLVNYPPVWLRVFDLLGIGPAATPWLGMVIDIAFIVAAFAFLGDRPVWQGLIYGAALISPAVMMGIERGNNDYLMFALVAAGLWLVPRETVLARVGGVGVLFLAVILKLFPIFSVAIVLIRRRSVIWPALAVGMLGLLYFLTNRNALSAAASNSMYNVFYSYGANVLFDGMERYFGFVGVLARWRTPVLAAAIAIAALLGLRIALRATTREAFLLPSDRWGAGFAVAATIYVFTFSIASSFDYRLAFLLFGLPQLMDWAAAPGTAKVQRLAARAALITILLSLWTSFYTVKLRLIDEVFNWMTFVLVLSMLVVCAWRFAAWLPGLLPVRTGISAR